MSRVTKCLLLLLLVVSAACGKSREVFQPQSFEELSWHTVAVMEGTIQADYAEKNCRNNGVKPVIFKTLVKGIDHKILDNADPLPLSIIRGMSHSITETVTPKGLEIVIR